MTKLYPCFHPYGNYLDNYYIENYDEFIDELVSSQSNNYQEINLGIVDGVIIMNDLKGDFTDYNCAVIEKENGDRDLYKIISKTFIKKDLWRVVLKLDCYSKFFQNVQNSVVLVDRLGIKNYNVFQPIFFNDEPFELSNIKKSQTKLHFNVAYYNTEYVAENKGGYLLFLTKDTFNGSGTTTVKATSTYADITVSTLADLDIYNKKCYTNFDWDFGQFKSGSTNGDYITYVYKSTSSNWTGKRISKGTFNNEITLSRDYSWSASRNIPTHAVLGGSIAGIWEYDIDTDKVYTAFDNYIKTTYKDGLDENEWKNYEGKIVYVQSENKYYKIEINNTTTQVLNQIYVNNEDLIKQAFNSDARYNSEEGIYMCYVEVYCTVNFTEISVEDNSFTVNIPSLRNCIDQPFQIVFIPLFNNNTIRTMESVGQYNVNNEMIERYVQALIETLGGDNPKLLDVQRIYTNLIPVSTKSDLFTNPTGKGNYQFFNTNWTDNSSQFGRILLVNQTYAIVLYSLDYADLEYYISYNKDVSNYKIEQQNKYILRSPSGQTSFDFSVAKNQGLTGFTLKINCRPYTTMYQLQPNFNGYYGFNYQDMRGLICTEDMSISQVNSEWEEYKRQNINYKNSFETNQSYERSQLQIDQKYGKNQLAVYNLRQTIDQISSSKSGMQFMSNTFNSMYNNAMDYWQLSMYQSYQKNSLALQQYVDRKQWNYSLQNIQALPLNTNKVSGIYNNNAEAFILETYTPTDYEIEVFENYIDLFGINVGAVIDLNDYVFDYIEGSVIKYNGEIGNEEYQELQDELKIGRRLYVSNEQEN